MKSRPREVRGVGRHDRHRNAEDKAYSDSPDFQTDETHAGLTMPLLDHFHPPLHGPRRWEGFHHAWATFIAAQLNQETLPQGYFAESEISLGPELEIDVANR